MVTQIGSLESTPQNLAVADEFVRAVNTYNENSGTGVSIDTDVWNDNAAQLKTRLEKADGEAVVSYSDYSAEQVATFDAAANLLGGRGAERKFDKVYNEAIAGGKSEEMAIAAGLQALADRVQSFNGGKLADTIDAIDENTLYADIFEVNTVNPQVEAFQGKLEDINLLLEKAESLRAESATALENKDYATVAQKNGEAMQIAMQAMNAAKTAVGEYLELAGDDPHSRPDLLPLVAKINNAASQTITNSAEAYAHHANVMAHNDALLNDPEHGAALADMSHQTNQNALQMAAAAKQFINEARSTLDMLPASDASGAPNPAIGEIDAEISSTEAMLLALNERIQNTDGQLSARP